MGGKTVYKGNIFSVVELDAKFVSGKRQVVKHKGAAGAVVTKGDGIIFVKQYREAVGDSIIEIPAGLLDGMTPEQCIRKELQEEVGAYGGKLTKLAKFYTSPGYSDEKFYLFLLEEPEIRESMPEESELLELVTVPYEKAIKMVSTGEIKDAKTIIGILMAKERLGY